MYKYIKRLFDIAFSFTALIILSPVLIITAFLVLIKLGRPVLYTHGRVGKDEKIFKLHKFRSMTCEKGDDGKALPDGERLTKFGKFLRKTSLDELPQLWDILRGKMSLIGPRPHIAAYAGKYDEFQSLRHRVRPGLSGLAQVNGRNSLGWERKFELDAEYVEKISFWLDVKIFFKTFVVVFKREGIQTNGYATYQCFLEYLSEKQRRETAETEAFTVIENPEYAASAVKPKFTPSAQPLSGVAEQ